MHRVQRDRAHNLLSPNYQGQNETAGHGVTSVNTDSEVSETQQRKSEVLFE